MNAKSIQSFEDSLTSFCQHIICFIPIDTPYFSSIIYILMNFVFVDEIGDPGNDTNRGATPYFGMAAISVADKNYIAIRNLLSQIYWLHGTATTIDAEGENTIRAFNILRGLKELAVRKVLSASALYIIKSDYGGRYLTWSDYGIPEDKWRYFLRNYLLRHLLEHHFSANIPSGNIDLVLDRVRLSDDQLINTRRYLNSEVELKEHFSIPPIRYVTNADSEYVGGLAIAHLLVETVKRRIKNDIPKLMDTLSDFVRSAPFKGEEKMPQ